MGKAVFKPIRYFGSKGTFYKKLLEYFPDPNSYNMYIEPFGGSYTMGLTATLPDKVCEIYNDKEKMYTHCIRYYKIRNSSNNLSDCVIYRPIMNTIVNYIERH